MVKLCFKVAFVLLLSAVSLQAQSRETLLKYLGSVPDWKPADAPTPYASPALGGLGADFARQLKLYGVTGVTVQSWQGPQGRIRTTFFEMLDPSAAYGFFTLRRSLEGAGPSPKTIGTENFQVGNQFYFWQSKYVIRIEGPSEAAGAFAQKVSENIFGRSEKPTVATLLPPANLVKESEIYLLSPDNIDRKFGVDPARLGFMDSAEASSATYRIDGKTIHLLLLIYPTQQVAKKYADLLDAETGPSAARKRSVRLLAIVAGTTDAAVIQSILDQVHYESKVTWNEPRPDVNVADALLGMFRSTGVALVITLVIGIGFGVFRIVVKSRYPNRVFDRAKTMEVIQLKLNHELTRKELSE